VVISGIVVIVNEIKGCDMSEIRTHNTWNAVIDSSIFVAFVVTTAPRFTGIGIHEWLSLVFAVVIIIHVVIHWQWIVTVGMGLFRKLGAAGRFSFVLNLLLFIAVTLVIYSGVAISRDAMPALGIAIQGTSAWRGLHHSLSNISVVLIGLHLALHWRWIVNLFRRQSLASAQ
jgi:hypothetical protein